MDILKRAFLNREN
jgi:hypothetical protein